MFCFVYNYLSGDAEEIEDEQREKEHINKINGDFSNFIKRCEEFVRPTFCLLPLS